MQDLVAWIQAGPWRTSDEPERQTARNQNIEDFAASVLERRWRKLKQHGRHLERLSPEQRHRIRIEAKKLRYACEFFSGLLADGRHRKRYQVFITALGDLQARLGDLNDILNGNEIAAELASHKATPACRSHARHAAGGHLDDQDKRAAALLISACEAISDFRTSSHFGNDPIEEHRHISKSKDRSCSVLSPAASSANCASMAEDAYLVGKIEQQGYFLKR